jgi:hypothetical protein
VRWRADIAYIVGLITTDGSLSKDGRHIVFVYKDIDQLDTFKDILHLKVKIGTRSSSYKPNKEYYHVQFSNIKLYKFLLKIGLTPNKTKTIGALQIPDQFFADFLRGHIDGDGSISSYYDPRWKNSFMVYTTFLSASKKHLEWIQRRISNLYRINCHVVEGQRCFRIRIAKKDSLRLWRQIYSNPHAPCLKRKLFKVQQSLAIIHEQAGML